MRVRFEILCWGPRSGERREVLIEWKRRSIQNTVWSRRCQNTAPEHLFPRISNLVLVEWPLWPKLQVKIKSYLKQDQFLRMLVLIVSIEDGKNW